MKTYMMFTLVLVIAFASTLLARRSNLIVADANAEQIVGFSWCGSESYTSLGDNCDRVGGPGSAWRCGPALNLQGSWAFCDYQFTNTPCGTTGCKNTSVMAPPCTW